MTKITNISLKNENDALLLDLDTYIKNDIEITIVNNYFEKH